MPIADEDDFRGFARSHAAALRRSAYLLCGDWHLADALVQTTLIKMRGAWPRITRRHQSVNYARRTLLRCWLDERRRPWRRSERRNGEVPDAGHDAADPANAHHRRQLREELFRALAAIAPRQRAVIVLRYFESLSIAETAAALRCSEGGCRRAAARIRHRPAGGQGADPAASAAGGDRLGAGYRGPRGGRRCRDGNPDRWRGPAPTGRRQAGRQALIATTGSRPPSTPARASRAGGPSTPPTFPGWKTATKGLDQITPQVLADHLPGIPFDTPSSGAWQVADPGRTVESGYAAKNTEHRYLQMWLAHNAAAST